jgi:UDP-N-acetylglucosamine 4,6-dehydratase
VIPLFQQQAQSGKITITDARMTRFWITLPDAVQFVIESINEMKGGEVFVPRIPSVNVVDIAEAVAPNCEIKYTGIRPGEKLHESLGDDYHSDKNEEWLTVEDVQRFLVEYQISH